MKKRITAHFKQACQWGVNKSTYVLLYVPFTYLFYELNEQTTHSRFPPSSANGSSSAPVRYAAADSAAAFSTTVVRPTVAVGHAVLDREEFFISLASFPPFAKQHPRSPTSGVIGVPKNTLLSAMPLFGKKDVSKKTKKDAEKSQSIEDKYDVKDLLGTSKALNLYFNISVKTKLKYFLRDDIVIESLSRITEWWSNDFIRRDREDNECNVFFD
ncbi:hypothetical protein ACI65C_003936 [Semiaphis heraclei]